MPLIEQSEALRFLGPHLQAVRSDIVLGAWADYLALPDTARITFSTITRAGIVQDQMVQRAVRYFSGVEGGKIIDIQKLFLFILDQRIALRFKKFDSELLSRNQPTKQVADFRAQAQLPGIEAMHNLEAGYVLNETEQEIMAVYLVCPNMNRNYWEMEITTGKPVTIITDLFEKKAPETQKDEEAGTTFRRKKSGEVIPINRDGNKFNAEMLVLAREYRGLTQGEVAAKTRFAQAKIAKIEGGMQADVSAEEIACFARALDFPIEFFFQNEERIGYGSSAYYYRKKADLTAQDRKKIHGLVNILRINIKRLLSSVDIESKRRLPRFYLDDYGGSPQKVARALRAFWQLPDGPVKDVTRTIESAGVFVLPCKFGTRAMDATSLWLAEMPPLIFVNENLPGDRWRFTLCHELAHLVAHEVPCETMEDEADNFAAEFLMPESEIRPHFHRMQPLRIPALANLKSFWKVSIAALVERAHDLGFLTDNQRRHMYVVMSRLGYRSRDRAAEPNPIPREEPRSHKSLLRMHATDLDYSQEELAKLLKINLQELKALHGASDPSPLPSGQQKPRLEIVR